MPATVQVTWNQAGLDSAITSAYAKSVQLAAGTARKLSHSSKAGVIVVGTAPAQGLAPTGLGKVFEYGRRGGSEITPRTKKALKLGNTGYFAAHVTEGAMRPYPYIRPAAQLWANGEFQATARGELAARGYR